jgi:hypothetical protein
MRKRILVAILLLAVGDGAAQQAGCLRSDRFKPLVNVTPARMMVNDLFAGSRTSRTAVQRPAAQPGNGQRLAEAR